SDCSGGAGIQADIKTMSAIGVFGMSVIVSVVAENTSRVISIEDVSAKVIADQIDAVFEDIEVDAVKIGMLSTPVCMKTVAEKINQYSPKHVVVDPVMYAKNGCPLMQEAAAGTLIDAVLPIATLLTPNLPEAEKITGMQIEGVEDMKKAAKKIVGMGAGAVLLKGGHLTGDALDVLYDGRTYHTFTEKRIRTKNTHGTGCTLSSAVASYLALGDTLEGAVEKAKAYVTGAIEHAHKLGKGYGPTNHFYRFYP
ncbi:MAG: bifunctional hydroxymethylpyrimidine kinase/phosphomethylpyrimidine kinase, partial [Oscillospiraceae bacterium]|nr:bifunctional hydroxymethylpyrimidine kinase/phosphomethylpyrimidine kinase [Oscillospiraceae bacterium]